MNPYIKMAKTGYIERRLNKILKTALSKLKIRHTTAAVILVRGGDLKKIKARYYKKNISREVDVLAFPEPKGFPHPESRKRFLGEIYLNKELTSNPRRLMFFLVHGFLHLLGYSHNKKHDTLKMQSLEKRLMNRSLRSLM